MPVYFPSEVKVRFKELTNQLNEAYGFGFSSDQDKKIIKVIDAALELTSLNLAVSQEEFEFYRSANNKIVLFEEGLDQLFDQLKKRIDAITSVIDLSEITAKEVKAEFLAKTNFQRTEYLTSNAYRSLVSKANKDTAAIKGIANKIQQLLFKVEKGTKTDPFKDLAAFAEHRKAISELYHEVADLGKRQARIAASLSPESLCASEQNGGWISSHPYISGLTGIGIAAASVCLGTKIFG